MTSKSLQSALHIYRGHVHSFQHIVRICLVLCMLATGLPFSTAQAESKDATPLEYRIKSAFLFNFCKFVSWPETSFPQPDAPLWVCVFGNNPFGNSLDALSGKQIRNHPLQIRYTTDLEIAKRCHLIFVDKSIGDKQDEIISQTKGLPILTIGDMEKFARRGGMINFFWQKNKIRFEINLSAANAAGMNISSQLLKLAKITGSE